MGDSIAVALQLFIVWYKKKPQNIPADPTTRQKKRLVNLPKKIKAEGSIKEPTYRKMYPTGADPKNYMGNQRSIKQGSP